MPQQMMIVKPKKDVCLEWKIQKVINELQGEVPAIHLQGIATRIANAEEKAESLEHALTQVKQLAEKGSEHFGPARLDIAERANEALTDKSGSWF